MASAAKEFWNSLTKPSPLAVALVIGLVFSAITIFFFFLTPEFMINHGDFIFAEEDRDYDIFSTTQSLLLKSSGIEKPKLIILGASTTRAAFLEDDMVIQKWRRDDMNYHFV